MAQSESSPETNVAPAEHRVRAGLQKHLGFQTSTLLTLAGCLGLVELLPLGIGIGLWPSANLIHTIAFAVGSNIVLVLLYTLIGAAVPHSGADYVLASRVLPAPLAFAGTFCMLVAAAMAVGAIAVLVSQAVISPFLLYTSAEFQNSNLADFAVTMLQPQGAIIAGTVVLFLAFLLSTLSPKTNARTTAGLLLLALAGWAAILFQLANADPAGFAARWDNVIGQGSFAGQVSEARALSLMFTSSPSPLFLIGIPLGFLIFFGARLPVLHSGEIKGPPVRSTLWSGWLAILLSAGLVIGSMILLNRALPADWLAAESHLFLYNNQLQKPALPWLPFYAALLQPNYLLFCLSTAGILAGLVAALQATIRAFGRLVYALAKDGFLVDLARFVHAGSHNPLVAHLIFTIVAQVGVSLAANAGVVKTLHSTLFAMVCTQLFPALAAIFHPLAKRGWIQRGESSGGKVNSALLVFFGFLAVVIFGWTIAVSLLFPAQGAAIGTTDFIVLGIGFVIGLVLYFWQAILSRRRGMDLLKPYSHFPED